MRKTKKETTIVIDGVARVSVRTATDMIAQETGDPISRFQVSRYCRMSENRPGELNCKLIGGRWYISLHSISKFKRQRPGPKAK
jgi:hypothetical protein